MEESEVETPERLTRHRFPGGFKPLEAVFKPIGKRYGPAFCKYKKEGADAKEKRLSKRGSPAMVRGCIALQSHLAFKKSDIERSLKSVFDAHKASWKMTTSLKPKWVATMTSRVSEMFQFVSKNLRKKSHPSWLTKMLKEPKNSDDDDDDADDDEAESGEDAGMAASMDSTPGIGPFDAPATPSIFESSPMEWAPGPAAGVAAVAAAAAPQEAWSYEWSRELELGYRCLQSNPLESTVFAEPLDPEWVKKTPADELIVLKFEDGAWGKIPDMTVGQLATIQKARGGGGFATHTYWETESELTHNRCALRQRIERTHVVSLYEQGKQIDQIKVWPFANNEPLPFLKKDYPVRLPDEHEAILKAVAFFTLFAEKYVKGENLKDIKKEKNEALAAYKKANVCKHMQEYKNAVGVKKIEEEGVEVKKEADETKIMEPTAASTKRRFSSKTTEGGAEDAEAEKKQDAKPDEEATAKKQKKVALKKQPELNPKLENLTPDKPKFATAAKQSAHAALEPNIERPPPIPRFLESFGLYS